ncbi:hypothetical protein LU293_02170 [Moraxella nasovis]|uniref:hypothetical protein n=1 Tax=Moraxella nasovis TaxID=2904121 RepID=UPI001F61A42E|nr:hypothetical protein [Moraxella nasovis]UNU73738.1 hypothetical protein LU293_02170 [Moraxella nasovis]
MKAIKLSAIAVALLSTTAMANVVTDGVKTTGTTVVNSGKTLFTTLSKPASISAEVSTLGYGGSIAWSANEKTEVVAGWNGADTEGTVDLNANDSYLNYKKVLGKGYENFKGDFAYDLSLNNPYIGVNLRPFANSVTVSTGVIYSDNKLKAKLSPKAGETADISIDGRTHTIGSGESVAIEAKHKNTLAPYATIGYRPNLSERWGLFGEVGAAYVGDIKADVKSSAKDLVLESDVKKEFEEASLEWWPIVKVGATLRF